MFCSFTTVVTWSVSWNRLCSQTAAAYLNVQRAYRSAASACTWPRAPQNLRCTLSVFTSTSSRPLKISWAHSGWMCPGSIHTQFQPLASVISSFQTAAQDPRGDPERRPEYQRRTLIWAPSCLLRHHPSYIYPGTKWTLPPAVACFFFFFICYYMRFAASCLHVPALIKIAPFRLLFYLFVKIFMFYLKPFSDLDPADSETLNLLCLFCWGNQWCGQT